MRRKRLLIAIVFPALAAIAAAQTAEYMDGILASKAITVGQASYLVLVAADRLGEEADDAAAFAKLEELGWAPKAAAADPIKYSAYSYILMRAFGLKGGIMYSLFPSPRYAYRELTARQMIQGRSDPQATVDGAAALRALSRVLDIAGVEK